MSTAQGDARYGQSDGIRFYRFHRWLNPFRTKQATLWAPFIPSEIERELHPFMFRQARRSDPGPIFQGSFRPDDFQLRWFRRDGSGIAFPFQETLSVRYEPTTNGTVLHLSLGMPNRGKIAFLGFAVLYVMIIALNLLSLWHSDKFFEIVSASVWILTGTVWLGWFITGRWIQCDDSVWYQEFLSFVLMGHPMDDARLNSIPTARTTR